MKKKPKKAKPKDAPAKAIPVQSVPRRAPPAVALLCVLCLGGLCMYSVNAYLSAAGVPPLFVNFVHKPDGTLPLHFFNAGEKEITLDLAGMQRFLFHPAGSGNRYILQVRNKPFGSDEAENRRRRAMMKKLAPKEAFEIGDLRSVIALLPDTTLSLVAAYTGTEEVRSLPMILREEKREEK